jgi:hypothetical protein
MKANQVAFSGAGGIPHRHIGKLANQAAASTCGSEGREQ